MIDSGLPGAEIVTQGLADGLHGEETAEALALQAVGARLRALGIDVVDRVLDPEIALYARLQADDLANAYGRYNSLLRRLDSFASALERRVRSARQRNARLPVEPPGFGLIFADATKGNCSGWASESICKSTSRRGHDR